MAVFPDNSGLTPAQRQWHDERIQAHGTLQPDLLAPRPAVPEERLRRFAVLGDTGSGSRHQWEIAEAMKRVYERTPYASVLMLGDNVYEYGEPRYFTERIYAPYAGLFMAGVRFYPVLGNHDARRGYEEAQLRYWGAPRYYRFSLREAEFFAIDATLLRPGFESTYKHRMDWARRENDKQMAWLKKSLAESQARTRVVLSHYPLYSSGSQGIKEQLHQKVRRQLEPVLASHDVTLCLSGHDHLFERTKPIKGVTYIVSGAAAKVQYLVLPLALHPRHQMVAWRHHFLLFEVQPDGRLTYQVMGKQAEVLAEGEILPR